MAWTIGLDPVELSKDAYEMCLRMSTDDEGRKHLSVLICLWSRMAPGCELPCILSHTHGILCYGGTSEKPQDRK